MLSHTPLIRMLDSSYVICKIAVIRLNPNFSAKKRNPMNSDE